jgi:hypothetical protein
MASMELTIILRVRDPVSTGPIGIFVQSTARISAPISPPPAIVGRDPRVVEAYLGQAYVR